MNELPDDMKAYLDKLNSEKEYLCAAYLAETGLKPSEVKIIERRGPEFQFYLQRKDWVGDVETLAMNDMRYHIAALESNLAIAKSALREIIEDPDTASLLAEDALKELADE